MKKTLATILALCILLTSSVAFATGSTDSANTTKFNGESIFRGLFMGQGEVAKLFPNIWTKELLAKVDNKESKKLADDIVLNVKKIDPGYFAELEKASYSGNQLRVKASLTKGQDLIGQAAKKMQKDIIATDDTSLAGTGQAQCLAVGYLVYAGAVFTVAAAVTHAVALTAGGAVAAYLVLFGGKYVWSSENSDNQGSLQQDMIVNSVVKAFS